METRANYVMVGSFVLGALALLVIFALWLARSELNEKQDTYLTYFTGSVTGLRDGSLVRYRGVPVGAVSNIVIDPSNIERIKVSLKLTPGTPIKIDSVASLGLEGITGGAYVDITGGTQSSPALTAPDGQIPVIKSQNSALASLVDDAPKLISKLMDLADRAGQALSPDNVQSITDMLTNLKTVSTDLTTLAPSAQEAVKNVNGLVTDLHAQLPRLIDTLQQDGVAVKDAAGEFHQVASNIDSLIGENREPIRDFTGNGLYEMTALITQLRGLTDTLTRVADRLDRDPQRYLFGGGARQGVDPNRPLPAGVPTTGAGR